MFVVTGLNHRTASVATREKLVFPVNRLAEAFSQLKVKPGINGCVILSTCNRVELYAAVEDVATGVEQIETFISEYCHLPRAELTGYLYTYTGLSAVEHLFRVAAGLDSMVLGETEILGQVRDAYRWATQFEATNSLLNTCWQQAITVGKKVRTVTRIDQHAVSVSYVAVELAKQVFGYLTGLTTLVIGAGEMSVLAAKYLVASGVSTVLVSNRSYDRAVTLAGEIGGRAVRFTDLHRCLETADIVISCTAAPHYLLYPAEVARVMTARAGRPLCLIDIAVPRDIDSRVGNLPGVTLYDIDDLQQVVLQHLEQKEKAALQAQAIIAAEVENFRQWLNTLTVVPTIVALKARANHIKEMELQRAFNRLAPLGSREKKVISSLASSIVNQLLHDPIMNLKQCGDQLQGRVYCEVMERLFGLNVDNTASGDGAPVCSRLPLSR
jgi:glutamyl-tRNA reductase